MVYQLQVDGEHGIAFGHVHLLQKGVRDVQAGLGPHHVEVATKLYTVLLQIVIIKRLFLSYTSV